MLENESRFNWHTRTRGKYHKKQWGQVTKVDKPTVSQMKQLRNMIDTADGKKRGIGLKVGVSINGNKRVWRFAQMMMSMIHGWLKGTIETRQENDGMVDNWWFASSGRYYECRKVQKDAIVGNKKWILLAG